MNLVPAVCVKAARVLLITARPTTRRRMRGLPDPCQTLQELFWATQTLPEEPEGHFGSETILRPHGGLLGYGYLKEKGPLTSYKLFIGFDCQTLALGGRGRSMLEGLDTINWASLTHAHGAATNVPGLLRSLLSENAEAHTALSTMLVLGGENSRRKLPNVVVVN